MCYSIKLHLNAQYLDDSVKTCMPAATYHYAFQCQIIWRLSAYWKNEEIFQQGVPAYNVYTLLDGIYSGPQKARPQNI